MSRRITQRDLETTIGVVEQLLRAAGVSSITASEVSRWIARGARLLARGKAIVIDDADGAADG